MTPVACLFRTGKLSLVLPDKGFDEWPYRFRSYRRTFRIRVAVALYDIGGLIRRYCGLNLRCRIESRNALGGKQFWQPIVLLPSIVDHGELHPVCIAPCLHAPEQCAR